MLAQSKDASWSRPSWWNRGVAHVEADSLNPSGGIGSTIADASLSELLFMPLKPSLYIVRQQYRLKHDGEYYGKNNQPFYGESYSLGIKIAGGMYLSGDVVEPWKRDVDYQRINASGGKKYEPVLFRSYQRALSDSVYRAVYLDFGTRYVTPVNEDKSLYLHEDAKSDFGLGVDEQSGLKGGFLVWAYTSTSVQDSAMAVRLRQVSLTIEAGSESTLIDMTPNEPDKIIGGLYVIPKYERAQVQYMLAGVAVKTDNQKWGLQLLVKEEQITRSDAPQRPSAVSGKKSRLSKPASTK